jgi:membrane-bound lytic murein transglycosylase D
VVASVAPAEPPLEEMIPGALAGDAAPAVMGPVQTALLSDPSDYSVDQDNSIEVQPLETLGHYGDWLEIKTQRLRDLNGLAFRTPVEVGQRIHLDLGKVDAKAFEQRRIAYQRSQQDAFFRQHVITGVTEHTIRRGDSIWIIALRQYQVPVWLFRQYNPAIDMHKVRPGTKVQIPLLTDVSTD